MCTKVSPLPSGFAKGALLWATSPLILSNATAGCHGDSCMHITAWCLWRCYHWDRWLARCFSLFSVMFYSPLFLLINLNLPADVFRSAFHSVCRSHLCRQEKLQLQEEQERARREVEEERLRLQQLKVWHIHRKSLSSKHVFIHTCP